MKTVVVDASVAICWFVREAGSLAASRLIRNDVCMIAPSLILPELANAVWEKHQLGQLEAEQAAIACRGIHRLIAEIVDMAGLIGPATALARETDHRVSHCIYVALARRCHTKLVTLDRELVTTFAATGEASRVVLIGDWLLAS